MRTDVAATAAPDQSPLNPTKLYLGADGEFRTEDDLHRGDWPVADVLQRDDVGKGRFKTYNFSVEGTHTYIANGLRVHNDSLIDHIPIEVLADPTGHNLSFPTFENGDGTANYEIADGTQVRLDLTSGDANGDGVVLISSYKQDDDDLRIVQHINEETGEVSIPVFDINGVRYGSEIGSRFGSHLGAMIGGDDPFIRIGAQTVGAAFGATLGNFVHESIFHSVFVHQETTTGVLSELFERNFELISITEIATDTATGIGAVLIAEAAESLGLDGFEGHLFTEYGSSITEQFVNNFENISNFSSIGDELFSGISLPSLGDVVASYVISEIGGSIRDKLIQIDNDAEAAFVTMQSLAGSFIGNFIAGPIGGAVGSFLGEIWGSFQYEFLDWITGGWIDELFDDDPYFYVTVTFDESAQNLIYLSEGGKRDGADNYEQIVNTVRSMNDHYMSAVNAIIDDVGGSIDLSGFYPVVSEGGRLNHSRFGYHHDDGDYGNNNFNVILGEEYHRYDSLDIEFLVNVGIEHEVETLIFYGGDLLKIRAINKWEEKKADISAGQSVGLLLSYLQIADDYRRYLDNTAEINALIASSPDSAFAVGWAATLIQAESLGLNQSYFEWFDGVAGREDDDTILSADGDDTLFGNGGNDEIHSFGGADLVYAGAGNDLVHSGSGDDIVGADDGDDEVHTGSGNDTVYGGSGSDTIYGDRGDDFLLGDADGDHLYGGDGDDRAFGGEGNDYIRGGSGDDELAGEGGSDEIHGDAGDDIIFGDHLADVGEDRLFGEAGNDLIRGGAAADTISGGDGDDDLYGDEGDDTVSGGLGNDAIFGGTGNNTLRGDEGEDIIRGGVDRDQIEGGADDDLLFGLLGDDEIDGGSGNDIAFGDEGADVVSGGSGNDILSGWTGDDMISGGIGNDTLFGEDHNDHLNGGDGDDIIYGDRQPEPVRTGPTAQQVMTAADTALGYSSYGLVYQGPEYTVDSLAAAPHEMLIINPAKDSITTEANSEVLWTAEELSGMKSDGKMLIGYFNVANVNSFTDNLLWDADWTDSGLASDNETAGAPAWLGDLDPAFPETRAIDHLVDTGGEWLAKAQARLHQMIDAGFDGVFLDDILKYYEFYSDSTENVVRAAAQYRDFIVALEADAQSYFEQVCGAGSDFHVIANGAPYIVHDANFDNPERVTAQDEAYFDAVDAILVENYFRDGQDTFIQKTIDEFGTRGVGLLALDSDVASSRERVSAMKDAVDRGFLPFVTSTEAYESLDAPVTSDFGDFPADGDDEINGGAGDDTLFSGGGNDEIEGGIGADTIDGGSGDEDVAYYIGARAEYSISQSNGVYFIAGGLDGGDLLTNIEKIAFSDGTFDIGSLINVAPDATVGDQTLALLAWRRLSDVLDFTDANGDDLQSVNLWDSQGRNSWYADGQMVNASSGYQTTNLDGVWFQGDPSAGSQTMWVQANDGQEWSAWDSFTLTTQGLNLAPVATVDDQTIGLDSYAWKRLDSVLSVTDANDDEITQYQVWDSVGGDNWWADGGIVDASTGYTTDDLSGVWFKRDDAESTQTLWVRANDGEEWGAWDSFNLISA